MSLVTQVRQLEKRLAAKYNNIPFTFGNFRFLNNTLYIREDCGDFDKWQFLTEKPETYIAANIDGLHDFVVQFEANQRTVAEQHQHAEDTLENLIHYIS